MNSLLSIIQKPKDFFSKILLSVLIFASFVGQVRAQSNQNLWQLDDGPLTPELWELVVGDLNDWQVIGGRLQGHLLPPPADSSYRSGIVPQPKLWPITGNYQFAFDFIALDEADKNFGVLFDYQFNSRGKILLTYLSFHFIDQKLYVETFTKNVASHRALVPCPLVPGHTYRFKLIYQKPDFQLLINNQLFFCSKTDFGFWPEFFEPGRPFFYLTKGNHQQSAVIYNNFELSFFPQLSVPYFSQLNVDWANEIYDHSQEFFDPPLTIASSGCALTSAAMLLNYYGYDTFPDEDTWSSELRGERINPETLNLWLTNEADGYVGAALVNWLAITRLTALLAESVGENEVLLEFTHADFKEEEIVEQLKLDQPLIADLDGHFVVVTGISDDNQDSSINRYLINDPSSINSTLDQKQTPIQSLRLFQSSKTDLSYWLLLSPEKLDFQVFNEEQEILLAIIAEENNLLNTAQPWLLYYWPKPDSGDYFWQFNLSDLEKLNSAQLFIYQNNGHMQIFNLADYVAKELQLKFRKDQLSELSINKGLKNLLHYHRYLLNHLLQQQKKQLILGKANNANRYQQLIEQFLAFYQL